LRRSHDALLRGSYHPVAANGDLLAFVRSDDHGRILVALNFGSRLLSVPTRGLAGTLLLSSDPKRQGDSVADTLVLQPNEGVVIELAGST
jgi:alpha-glucosidase